MPDRTIPAGDTGPNAATGSTRPSGAPSEGPAPATQPSLADLSARQKDIERQRDALLALRAELDATARKLAREQARVDQLHSAAGQPVADDEPGHPTDDPFESERTELQREREALSALRDELAHERDELDRRAADLATKTNLFREKRAELIALREETRQRQEQVDHLERKMAEIWSQLELQNNELEAGKQQLRDAQASLAQATAALDAERTRLQQFERSLQVRHAELEERALPAAPAPSALAAEPAPGTERVSDEQRAAVARHAAELLREDELKRAQNQPIADAPSSLGAPGTIDTTDTESSDPDLAAIAADLDDDDEDIDSDNDDDAVDQAEALAPADDTETSATSPAPATASAAPASTIPILTAPIAVPPAAPAAAVPPLHQPAGPGPHPLSIFVLLFRAAVIAVALVAIGVASWFAAVQVAPPTWRATIDLALSPTTDPADASTDWPAAMRTTLMSDLVVHDAFAQLARTGPSPFDSPDALRPALQSTLTLVPRDNASREFQLTFTSTDPVLAARILDAEARALHSSNPNIHALSAAFWGSRPVHNDQLKVTAEFFAAGVAALALILLALLWRHRRVVSR